jgi:hypothetical protein
MAERESLSNVAAAWSQVVSAMVGAVAAVVAGVVGIQSIEQGKQQNEEAKTQQTLQFFATFNAQTMLTTRELLGNEDWCARYGYVQSESYEPAVTLAHIVSVVDFFDAVHNSCTKQSLCNQTFADELFSPYAVDFYDDLSKTILDRRTERGDSFGEGIAALAHETAPIEDVVARYARDSCRVTGPSAAAPGVTAPQ